MKIAGIDLSSHAVDVVLLELDSDEATWTRGDLEGDDWLERLCDVRLHFGRGWSGWDDVCAIGIELPAGHHGTRKLLPFFGAVVACLPPGAALKAYVPGEWKRLSVGKGNASKAEVAHWALSHAVAEHDWVYSHAWPSQWPQDAYDAYAIAWACRSELVVEAAA